MAWKLKKQELWIQDQVYLPSTSRDRKRRAGTSPGCSGILAAVRGGESVWGVVKPLEFEQKLIESGSIQSSRWKETLRSCTKWKSFIDRREREQGGFIRQKKLVGYCTIISFRAAISNLFGTGDWFCGRRFFHGWWGRALEVQAVMPAMGSCSPPTGWPSS